jgi:outer membrane receptor protein involved in Fe transport
MEFRHEGVSFPNAINFVAWPTIPQREVLAAYAEAQVPVIASKQNWRMVNRLDLNLAVRTEDYNDFGRSTTPRYGVAWRPTSSLLVRGSYGEGFLAPPLYQASRGFSQNTVTWSNNVNSIDPLRGNQNYAGGTYLSTTGGNPNLKAQRSENWTYGIVLDVPKVKGLSLSFDWFDNIYYDRLGNVASLADKIRYFPEVVTRGANLPGDQPGWPGPVVAVDNRIRNIAVAKFVGYNFGARWSRSTLWGDFVLTTSGEKTLTDESRVLPHADPSAFVNKRFRPMRITSSLFWTRGGWDAGVTSIYGGRYWVDSTNQTLSPSRWTDDVMRWDVNAGYDFGRNKAFGAKGSPWWQRALHDTKLRVTVINVFNTEPPLDALGFFSGSVIDIRLRRYVIDFTKRF